jgi:hypothetical protein
MRNSNVRAPPGPPPPATVMIGSWKPFGFNLHPGPLGMNCTCSKFFINCLYKAGIVRFFDASPNQRLELLASFLPQQQQQQQLPPIASPAMVSMHTPQGFAPINPVPVSLGPQMSQLHMAHDMYNHQVSRLLAREICACTAWLNSLSFNYALFRRRIPCSTSIRIT